jgi:hypothetical protein
VFKVVDPKSISQVHFVISLREKVLLRCNSRIRMLDAVNAAIEDAIPDFSTTKSIEKTRSPSGGMSDQGGGLETGRGVVGNYPGQTQLLIASSAIMPRFTVAVGAKAFLALSDP